MATGSPMYDVTSEGWTSPSTKIGPVLSTITTNSTSYVSTMLSSLSTETSTHAQNFTSADDIQTTVSDVINKVNDVILRTTPSQPYYEYSTAQFEVLLPCIFGMFVVLALSFIVFYSKHTNQYEVLEKRSTNDKNQRGTVDHDWSASHGLGEVNGAFSFG